MEYDLYHDESQVGGYWHGMLLVPRRNRQKFLEQMNLIRKETFYDGSNMLKGLKSYGKRFNCADCWVQLGKGALMQYFKNEPQKVYLKKPSYSQTQGLRKEYKELITIDSEEKIIGAKFILFKEKISHNKTENRYKDFGARIEKILSMAMKGGFHFLGDEKNPIIIKSIHFDGWEHYHRHIERDRILKRIYGLRNYCSLDNAEVDDRRSNHNIKNKKDVQHYDDCQFLQMTDLLVGGFRTVLGECKNNFQRKIALPLKALIDEKWQRSYHGLKNSRWFEGFYLAECWFDNNGWNFQNFKPHKKELKTLFD